MRQSLTRKPLAALGLIALLIAVGSAAAGRAQSPATPPSSPSPSPSSSPPSDIPAGSRQSQYLGEVHRVLAGGEPAGMAAVLMRRTETPSANLVIDQVIMLEADEAPRETFAIMRFGGAKFTLSERGERFRGEGEAQGPLWHWTGWTWRVNLAGNAGTISAIETVTPEGLGVERRYFSPAGELRMEMWETYRPISAEIFDMLYQQLMTRR